MCGDNEDTEMVPGFEKMHKLLDQNRCYCRNYQRRKS
jgi:hypothetical protein